MRLILTEKPSVAADFAKALSATRKDGYFENSDTIITYCVGHLMELFQPEDYNPNFKSWKMEHLPIIPKDFKHKPAAATAKQYNVVKNLLTTGDITDVLLATDAGREGELIGRLVLSSVNFPMAKVRRFWSSEALQPSVISAGIKTARPSTEYDALFTQGYNRSISDWIVGMNFSRFFSISMNGVFSFGRVQTSVLGMICQRERDIAAFIPKAFYHLKVDFIKNAITFPGYYIEADKDKFDAKGPLAPLIERIKKGAMSTITSVEKKQESKAPPLLYNLTALQVHANKIHGFTAQKTLDIAQKLYEEYKVMSYPRTPSRVLGESNVDLVNGKLTTLQGVYPEIFNQVDMSSISLSNKRVFDDSKLEDHHALIPLGPLPDSADQDSRMIYDMVLRSFAAAFSTPYIYENTKAILEVDGLQFRAKGKADVSMGWKAVYAKSETAEKEDVPDADALNASKLPVLSQGETVPIASSSIIENFTKPPAHFTEASLLEAMENPGKYLADDKLAFEKGTGLGTQATRATIIETLLHREYIGRNKKALLPTDRGNHFFNSIAGEDSISRFIRVDETARWEQLLKDSPDEFLSTLIGYTRMTFERLREVSFAVYQKPKDEVGKCPVCGKPVYEGKQAFYCHGRTDKTCEFSIWKEIAGTAITMTVAKALLGGKKSRTLSFMSKKTGKPFEAFLKLDPTNKVVFDFPPNKSLTREVSR